MKIVCFLFVVLSVFVWESDADAQVMDMRAFSRQRGARAYRVKTVAPVRTTHNQSRAVSSTARKQPAVMSPDASPGESKTMQKETSADISAQTEEMREYIQNNPHVRPDI